MVVFGPKMKLGMKIRVLANGPANSLRTDQRAGFISTNTVKRREKKKTHGSAYLDVLGRLTFKREREVKETALF